MLYTTALSDGWFVTVLEVGTIYKITIYMIYAYENKYPTDLKLCVIVILKKITNQVR